MSALLPNAVVAPAAADSVEMLPITNADVHHTAPSSTSHSTSPTPTMTTVSVVRSDSGLRDPLPHPLVTTKSSRAEIAAHEQSEAALQDWLSYVTRLKKLWSDVPNLTISYRDLLYDIHVPVQDPGIPNLAKSLWSFLTLKGLRSPKESFLALQPNSGIVRPGEMTLVLAPPGHGKSTLLKALAGRYHGDPNLRGELLYNNMTRTQALQAGLHVERLTAYVDQGEIHMALLTVRETLEFALKNSVADPALLHDPDFLQLSAQRVDFMLKLLGLKEAENTVLGDALIRGVSGGQRRRVTLGEMMITNARALFLDEITTGLDSAASFDILTALKHWTRLMNGSVMTALLQPTPECFALFDRIILLRHGLVVYDGPIDRVVSHFHDLGIPIPDDQDLADFLSDFLTDPKTVYYRTIYRAARKANRINRDPSKTVISDVDEQKHDYGLPTLVEDATADTTGDTTRDLERAAGLSPSALSNDTAQASLDLVAQRKAPLTTEGLNAAFLRSSYAADISALQQAAAASIPPFDVTKASDYTRAQFCEAQSHTVWDHFNTNLGRAGKVMRRNGGFWGPRIFQSIFLGFIFGGLFYQTDPSNYQARLGLIIFASASIGFANAAEIPFASQGKDVVYKQVDAGFYTAANYVWSVMVWQIPLAISESIIFSIIVYFMVGFDLEAGRFFFFLLIIFMTNVSVGCIFRACAYAAHNQDVANQMSAPIVGIMFVFAGFLILEEKIPRWLIWNFWISPFSWVLRSLAINEYDASRYDEPFQSSPFVGYRTGEAYLREWDIDPTNIYKWTAVVYLFGFWLFMMGLGILALATLRYPLTVGTKRFKDEDGEDETREDLTGDKDQVTNGQKSHLAVMLDKAKASAQHSASSFKMQTAATALPFSPVNLAWRDIHYTVMVMKDKKKVARKLLTGISGYAKAGQLTALMGASGAGKTTLMDVIAGRKTAGVIEGEILVNGYPKVTATFNRMCGYVEQVDNHLATQTVREALLFSAKMRLPREVSPQQRDAFINEVLDILELMPIADRIIGDTTAPGLSPGQLKRLTIGVELVSNPPVLFLDEPTSGLDSRAALIVMRVVKRIATTGRAVLCTIHQPSADLFYMFDRLLLLRSGGQEVFFGDLGTDGEHLVSYFENAPVADGQPRLKKPRSTNPASWMLTVIGGGAGGDTEGAASGGVDKYELYRNSKLRQINVEELTKLCSPQGSAPLTTSSLYAASYLTQYVELTLRTFQSYWRNPAFVWVRQALMLFLSCLFGFLYLQIGESSPQAAISKLSAVFMGIGFPGWIVMTSIIPVMLRNRVVFYREQSSFMYSPYAYAFGITVVEIPYLALSAIVFLCCFYPMVGFILTGTAFFKYFFVQYLAMFCFLSLGQLCASLFPDIVVANIMSQLIGTFAMLFSGLFLLAGQMPAGWKWIYYIDWIPKALIPISSVQFDCGDDCNQTFTNLVLPDGSTSNAYTAYTYILFYLDTGNTYWPYIGWLFLTLVVFRIFIVSAIANVNYMKR